MQLSPEQLSANGYRFQSSIRFESINQFVQDRLQRGGALLRLYWLCVVALVFAMSYVPLKQGYRDPRPAGGRDLIRLAGFLVIVLPAHEAIHGITYKLLGAPSISFHADWKRMFFFAAADRFVPTDANSSWLPQFFHPADHRIAGCAVFTNGILQLAIATNLGCIPAVALVISRW